MSIHDYDLVAQRASQPRVWLAAGTGASPEPADRPTVRDNRMCTWVAGSDGRYHSIDGFHHATWAELHARFDLVEVVPNTRAA
jgi:hypothetical protein